MSDPTLKTWNKLAGLYAEKFMDLSIYDESYDVFNEQIKNPTASILDIGCGPGNVSRYLYRKNPQWDFHGIDAAPNMLALYKDNIPSSTVTLMDIRNLVELTGTYNGIVCGFCIPYLNAEESERLVHTAAKLLSPDGVFYLSFVEGEPSKSGLVTASTGDQTYFYYHQQEELTATLQKAGFEKATVLRAEYIRSAEQREWHTILITKRQVISQ
jgi:2-polyprenyl-3-methyl-5-hydroxy-6-metoxy-1,4-benzoquinol methylase